MLRLAFVSSAAAVFRLSLISQVEGSEYEPYRKQVMAVAIAQQPDWVITNARRRAESIMDGGKAKYYHHAVDWLKFVLRAYQQSEQLKKWQTYYDNLVSKHSRKRKLISLMQVFK